MRYLSAAIFIIICLMSVSADAKTVSYDCAAIDRPLAFNINVKTDGVPFVYMTDKQGNVLAAEEIKKAEKVEDSTVLYVPTVSITFVPTDKGLTGVFIEQYDQSKASFVGICK